MNRLKTISLILLLLLAISACGTDLQPVEKAAILPVTEAETVAEATVTEPPTLPTATMPPTAVPSTTPTEPTATVAPTKPAPEPTEAPFVVEMDNCQSCHSDKEMLIDTADPVVEQESSESSGVG